MKDVVFIAPNEIRAAFSSAMSAMYRTEVPAYGTLMELVAEINAEVLEATPALRRQLEAAGALDRISHERHGAIRLGTPAELSMMRRVFAVMGMHPVGYYDLSTAGVPVHATAFRPVGAEALNTNPFRVFTSLLRIDLIADERLRKEAQDVLADRRIFTPNALRLTDLAHGQGGLHRDDADQFVAEILETFRWHDRACVSADMYRRLHQAHRLVADVVSFKGPHINHLTPGTLDIDAVQRAMPARGIVPKAVIEGPPSRTCPILLRQTSFKALDEAVSFKSGDGWTKGSHTARFGEIEQRGIALTAKGRALYDRLLETTRAVVRPAADGSNAAEYVAALSRAFEAFPDTWEGIRAAGLGYFTYSPTERGHQVRGTCADGIDGLLSQGYVRFDPIVYEDFLPVSAAGIFQSNLGDDAGQDFVASPNQQRFETALGAAVLDEFEHYAAIEQASIDRCLSTLRSLQAAE
ncbi:VOC family protein [Mesorhizobium sp. B2-3-4]|uniref:2-oxoadipate dioxygenase/decarboxylase HglS n=1 Tax=Mesorhizobium sp. B2-3-4 TaxID=2589959 RepID=UPI00112D93EF|nr:VOC family protein [Mesorhizobium sp. B2-3-4]TPM39156.1 VOC family protein [Mesorhizobium sp. B2-3-4]